MNEATQIMPPVPEPLLGATELANGSTGALLATYGAILEELRARDVLRTNNAPAGDYAEYLICRALGGTLERNSAKSADVRVQGTAIQVKARVVTDLANKSERQLSAIRSFDFQELAVVLFDPSYRVRRAVLLPVALIEQQAYVSGHVKARIFYATDAALSAPEARDITLQVQAAAMAANR